MNATDGPDILENKLKELLPDVLDMLLKDHTTQKNIFWATHDYEHLGAEYAYFSPITPDLITGDNGHVIMPRNYKSPDIQQKRKREKAEIFTPAWICNAQLNLIDEQWFGRKDVFNHENDDHTWTPTEGKIEFPKGKTWQDYVRDTRLEITCGEGPYLASRYDSSNGQLIPLENRIGIIDRKLRVISENAKTRKEWLKYARQAFQSSYGYEWQGDNLLLAREAMFYSYIEYFRKQFGPEETPSPRSLESIAYIISWNVWQMDGLKCVVPDSCKKEQPGIFGPMKCECPGCKNGTMRNHTGTYCLIRDWKAKAKKGEGPGLKTRFVDIIPKR